MKKHRRPHGRVSNHIHHNKPDPTKPTGPSTSTNPAKPTNPTRPTSAIRSSRNHPEADDVLDDRDAPHDHDAPDDRDDPDASDDGPDLPGYLDPDSPEFNPAEALQSLHLDIVELDALVNAADEAVAHVPPPRDQEGRCASDRAIALVTKVTEGSRALARRSYEIQDALTAHSSRRRAES